MTRSNVPAVELALAATFAFLLALPGCSAARPVQIDASAIQVAGNFTPSQLPPDGAPLVEGAGLLRVETDPREVRPGYASGEGDSLAYSVNDSYDVYDDAGKFVKHVVNYVKVTDTVPVTTQLAAGRYLLAIPDSRWPNLWVVATIESAKLTRVDARTTRPAEPAPPK